MCLSSVHKSDQTCWHLALINTLQNTGVAQIKKGPCARMSTDEVGHYQAIHLNILLPWTYLFETLWERQYNWRRAHSIAMVVKSARPASLSFTCRVVSVKDTIGIPPWISLMTQF